MEGNGGDEVGSGGRGNDSAFLEVQLDQSWDPKPPPKSVSKPLSVPACFPNEKALQWKRGNYAT